MCQTNLEVSDEILNELSRLKLLFAPKVAPKSKCFAHFIHNYFKKNLTYLMSTTTLFVLFIFSDAIRQTITLFKKAIDTHARCPI